MARGELPRHDNGLLNYGELKRYYPPNSVGIPFGIFSDMTWKNHHGYYTFELWVPDDVEPEDRTPLQQLRVDFRSQRQNRLMLLNKDEYTLHNKHRPIDPQSVPQESMEASMRDFSILDELRCATAGLLAATRDLGSYSCLNETLRQIDSAERVRFFEMARDEAIAKLEKPEITPPDVITSLIGRTAMLITDAFLYEVAIERMRPWQKLGRKPNFYPFDVHSFDNSITGSRTMLNKAFAAEVETIDVEDGSPKPKYDWSRHPVPASIAA